jgi:hypothetical protein
MAYRAVGRSSPDGEVVTPDNDAPAVYLSGA